MILAGRLPVPDGTKGLLFDMDGVLVDTLTMDFGLVNQIVATHLRPDARISRTIIRQYFPYQVAEFWPLILRAAGLDVPKAEVEKLVATYEHQRRNGTAAVHAGIPDILVAAREHGLGVGVVSNNEVAAIDDILIAAGLRDRFDVIVGTEGLAAKPAPDPYLHGARQLGQQPQHCVAIEDSLLGAEAAHRAGCYSVAVATGSNDLVDLAASPFVDASYASFGDHAVTTDSP